MTTSSIKKVFDNLFGSEALKTFKQLEESLDGLVLEIQIKLWDAPSVGKISKRSIEFRMMDEDEIRGADRFQEKVPTSNVDINKMFDRIEMLQRNQRVLLDRADDKILEIQEELKDQKFEILLVRRNLNASVIREAINDENTPTTSGVHNKRKISFARDLYQFRSSKKNCIEEYPLLVDSQYIIGTNGTQVDQKEYEAMQWKDAGSATRQLCKLVFGDLVLATHSLTGNQSPAFRGRERPTKAQLDPSKIADIIIFICSKFDVKQQLVRTAIASKCGDCARRRKRS